MEWKMRLNVPLLMAWVWRLCLGFRRKGRRKEFQVDERT
jgi:hypothetical protein